MNRSYGTIRLTNGEWCIECEPHVMMHAKRIFGQVSKQQHGKITMTASPAASRDIEWFLQRYPMRVENRDELDTLARRHDEAMATVHAILDRASEPPTFDLAIPARSYQRSAAQMLLKTGRLLLGDDVGLGKTCTAICAISDQSARPALVVTLTHLPGQWMEEFRRFAPGLRVWSPKKGSPQPRDMQMLGGVVRPDVIVMNYHKMPGWADTITQVFQPKTVVFDEVQELRTGRGTNKGAAADHIARACAYRLGMSATPIYNYGGEIRTILQFLEPDCLGTELEFEREWESSGVIKDPKALGSYLRDRGLMLRRVASEVSDEVPELAQPMRIPHLVDSDTATIEKAKSSAAEFARIVLSATASPAERMHAYGEIDWRMRQATGIAKAVYVAAFVRLLLESEQRVLLFGWHHAVYAIWMEELREFRPSAFTGEDSSTQKEAAKQAFLSGESRVLVMSLRSGAGLDGLQSACRCVVFGELDWSPGVHEQCIGRIHRPGQKDAVRAYFLHSDEGSDPVVVETLGIKTAQSRGIRDPHASIMEATGDKSQSIRKLAEECLLASKTEAAL